MLPVVRILGNGAVSRTFALLLSSVLIAGCSLKSAKDDAHLSLVLPNPHHALHGQVNVAPSPSPSGAPSAWNAPEFVCYGVNVTGPGIADTSPNPKPNPDMSALLAGTTACAYRGIVSNGFTFSAGQPEVSIDLQVPPGANRVIQLVGITNAAYCANHFLETGAGANLGAYEIGHVHADLFGDASVSIPISYVASETKRVDCAGGAAATVLAAPVLSLSPPNPILLRGTAMSPVHATNSGGAISSCTVAPALPPGLSMNPATCDISGTPTAVQASTNYVITATNAVGSSNFTITITVNDTPPSIAWSVATYDFTTVLVAGPYPTYTFTLTNSGGLPATGCAAPTISDASNFSLLTDTCGATNLAGGTSCTVTVRANPAAVGAFTTALNRTCTAGGTAMASPITVTGSSPMVTITAPSAGFVVNLANQAAVVATGSCSENGRNVVISGAVSATVACSAGAWSATLNFTAVADGPLTLTINHSDIAGNAATTVTRSLSKDSTPPTVSFASPAAGTYVGAANVGTFSVSGNCSEPGANVVISGAATASVACAGSTWSATLNLTAVAEGSFTLNANLMDAAGNAAVPTSRTFTKDTVAPTLTVTSPVANSYVNIANAAAFPMSGACSENGVPVVFSGPISTSTPCTGGAWTITANLSTPLDGAITITITQTDVAGNATSISHPLIKDTVAPMLASASVTNASPTFTKVFTLTFGAVTSGPYASYCINENNPSLAGCTFNLGSLPSTFTVSMTTGSKTLSVWIKDAAGNVSPVVTTNTITYDASCDTIAGSGTAPDPYQIATLPHLVSCLPILDISPSTNFRLMSSLSLSGLTAPIPNLQGVFDGNMLTLSALNLNAGIPYVGLFGTVTGGTVKNLILNGVSLNCTSTSTSSGFGAIAGQSTGTAQFINNHVTSATNVAINAKYNAGGIVGSAAGNAYFAMNQVDNLAISVAPGGANIGGIVGYYSKTMNTTPSDFYRNRVAASTVTTCGTDMGGLAGMAIVTVSSSGFVAQENATKLSMMCGSLAAAPLQLGGLFGTLSYNGAASIAVNISDSDVAGDITTTASSTMLGGLIGKILASTGAGNALNINRGIVRGAVTGSTVGAVSGGSDAVGPGLAYSIAGVYWLTSTYLTSAMLGTYVPASPTMANGGGNGSTALQGAGLYAPAAFDFTNIWTPPSTSIYPKLIFETAPL